MLGLPRAIRTGLALAIVAPCAAQAQSYRPLIDKDTPQPCTVIDQKELERAGRGGSVDDVLKNLPGSTPSSSAEPSECPSPLRAMPLPPRATMRPLSDEAPSDRLQPVPQAGEAPPDVVKDINPGPVEFEREVGPPEPSEPSRSHDTADTPAMDPLEQLRTNAWWSAWAFHRAIDECDHETANAMLSDLDEKLLQARSLAKAAHMAGKADNADAEGADRLVDDIETAAKNARSTKICKVEESSDEQPSEPLSRAVKAEDEFGHYVRRNRYCSRQEQIDDLQALQHQLIHTDESDADGQARGKELRAELQRVKAAEIKPCEPAPQPGTSAIDLEPDVSPPTARPAPEQAVPQKQATPFKDSEFSFPETPGARVVKSIPVSPIESFVGQADDAISRIRQAIDKCDIQTVTKLMPVLMQMSKRADALADTAREAGDFGNVNPTDLADLEWDLDLAIMEGHNFQKCPLRAPDSERPR